MSIPYSRYLVGSIPWYSVLIVLGVALAYIIGYREEKRVGLPQDTMIDVTLVAVPCGIIGARLYFVAMEWPQFANNLLSILYVWEGGVAIYGAVIGGGIGVGLYCRKKKLCLWRVADIVAPGLLLAQAIGRWGNYFNMEAFGPAIMNPAFQFFPLGVQILESGGYVWHMATFFYESVWNVFGFLALMGLRKRQKHDGNVFFWYLLIYGSGRFVIEQLRMDSLYLGGLRISQTVSLLICAVAACMLLSRAKPRKGGLFYAACLGGLAAIFRWFLLGRWPYAVLLLIIAGAMIFCRVKSYGQASGGIAADSRPSPSASTWRQLRSTLWILLPWLLDALGLIMARRAGLSDGFGLFLHSLLCSLALPCYVLWFQQRLSALPGSRKGATECPPEP